MPPATRHYFDSAGVQLCCVAFGGSGAPVLLLHGLGGRGVEWRSTAAWLTTRAHVWALDQRGHGQSAKPRGDYGRDAFVGDVVAAIEWLGAGPVTLIGQSLGGIHALLTAARRPDLVRALVVVEASPERNPRAPDGMRNWVASWPLPFPTLADARAFFSAGATPLYGAAWSENLVERPDGYWPMWELDDMAAAVADLAARDCWDAWAQVACPTLLVSGEHGFFTPAVFERMVATNAHARHIPIPGAGHDLHLLRPRAWQQALERFLDELPLSFRPTGGI